MELPDYINMQNGGILAVLAYIVQLAYPKVRSYLTKVPVVEPDGPTPFDDPEGISCGTCEAMVHWFALMEICTGNDCPKAATALEDVVLIAVASGHDVEGRE